MDSETRIVYEDIEEGFRQKWLSGTVCTFYSHIYEHDETFPDRKECYLIDNQVFDNYQDVLDYQIEHPRKFNHLHSVYCDDENCDCLDWFENTITVLPFVAKK